MNYALLDFDGYICKSFFANKEDMMDFEHAEQILKDLMEAARVKAQEFFEGPVKVFPVVSSHSWKKDIYPSYKRQRTRDDFLGVYREDIIKRYKPVSVEQLEADETLIMIADYLRAIGNNNYIIFSDDKDLRYYTERYCKINITESIVEQDPQELIYNQLVQMLVGDKEDNIQGVPKVGEKTAPKLLEQYGYTLEGVIKIFKDKEIEIDQTLRDLLLLIPMSDSYMNETEPAYRVANAIITGQAISQNDIVDSMISQVQFLNKKVREVYDGK